MKLILCLITILLSYSCIAQEVVFSNDEPNKNDMVIIARTIGYDNNLICFTEKYENDSVSVSTEGESIYLGKLQQMNPLEQQEELCSIEP